MLIINNKYHGTFWIDEFQMLMITFFNKTILMQFFSGIIMHFYCINIKTEISTQLARFNVDRRMNKFTLSMDVTRRHFEFWFVSNGIITIINLFLHCTLLLNKFDMQCFLWFYKQLNEIEHNFFFFIFHLNKYWKLLQKQFHIRSTLRWNMNSSIDWFDSVWHWYGPGSSNVRSFNR